MTDDPIETYGALFERDGDRYLPTPLTRGPWDPRAMHGGAPSALFAHVCEQHDPGPADFVARVTVELLRPVPLVPMTMRVRTIRPGRKVQWIEAALLDADDRELARATVLRLQSHDVDTSGSVCTVEERPPSPDGGAPPSVFAGRDRHRLLVGARRAHRPRKLGRGRTGHRLVSVEVPGRAR